MTSKCIKSVASQLMAKVCLMWVLKHSLITLKCLIWLSRTWFTNIACLFVNANHTILSLSWLIYLIWSIIKLTWMRHIKSISNNKLLTWIDAAVCSMEAIQDWVEFKIEVKLVSLVLELEVKHRLIKVKTIWIRKKRLLPRSLATTNCSNDTSTINSC